MYSLSPKPHKRAGVNAVVRSLLPMLLALAILMDVAWAEAPLEDGIVAENSPGAPVSDELRTLRDSVKAMSATNAKVVSKVLKEADALHGATKARKKKLAAREKGPRALALVQSKATPFGFADDSLKAAEEDFNAFIRTGGKVASGKRTQPVMTEKHTESAPDDTEELHLEEQTSVDDDVTQDQAATAVQDDSDDSDDTAQAATAEVDNFIKNAVSNDVPPPATPPPPSPAPPQQTVAMPPAAPAKKSKTASAQNGKQPTDVQASDEQDEPPMSQPSRESMIWLLLLLSVPPSLIMLALICYCCRPHEIFLTDGSVDEDAVSFVANHRTSGSDSLTPQELSNALFEKGIWVPPHTLQQLVTQMDRDRDGKIAITELSHFMRRESPASNPYRYRRPWAVSGQITWWCGLLFFVGTLVGLSVLVTDFAAMERDNPQAISWEHYAKLAEGALLLIAAIGFLANVWRSEQLAVRVDEQAVAQLADQLIRLTRNKGFPLDLARALLETMENEGDLLAEEFDDEGDIEDGGINKTESSPSRERPENVPPLKLGQDTGNEEPIEGIPIPDDKEYEKVDA